MLRLTFMLVILGPTPIYAISYETVDVGAWSLYSSGDPSYTSDAWTNNADGSFTGRYSYDGMSYTYEGANVVAQWHASCISDSELAVRTDDVRLYLPSILPSHPSHHPTIRPMTWQVPLLALDPMRDCDRLRFCCESDALLRYRLLLQVTADRACR